MQDLAPVVESDFEECTGPDEKRFAGPQEQEHPAARHQWRGPSQLDLQETEACVGSPGATVQMQPTQRDALQQQPVQNEEQLPPSQSWP